MLTFPGPFNCLYKFYRGNRTGRNTWQKNLQGQRRTKTMSYCLFRLLYRDIELCLYHDRELWFSVAIESLYCDGDFGLPIATESPGRNREPRSRRSHAHRRACTHDEGILASTTRPCAGNKAALRARQSLHMRMIRGFCCDKECFVSTMPLTRPGPCARQLRTRRERNSS